MVFIVPEVYADLAQAEFIGKVKVLGSPAVVEDDTLVGQPGETIHFPKWDTLTDLQDVTKDEALTVVGMGQSDSQATIKEAGKAVAVKDRDKLTALGDPQGEAVRQFGILAARKVDGALIAEALANAGRSHTEDAAAGATALSWDVLVSAIATFGDEFEADEFAGLYINSAQQADLFRDPNFIEASKIGDGTVLRRGQLGTIGGLAVLTSDRVTAGKFLLAKRNTLGALYKRRPIVEQDRDVLAREDIVTTNVHYAVKAITPSGLCVGTLRAA